MTKKSDQCDVQLIEDYLESGLTDPISPELEKHLEECEECQAELAKRAAEPQLWDEAVQMLKSGATESFPFSPEIPHERNQVDSPSVSSLSILDWLLPTDHPEMLGRVGDYEVSGIVGVGGMGAVLKAFDKSLLRVVAIKVMAPHLANSGSARSRFHREARAAAAITHDNVIDIHRVAEANGLPYLVMPYARGPSLQKRIDESGPLTAIETVRIGRQIASGLAAAHEQGLVHRDIKPANILLNDGIERLLITDFGLARAMDDVSMTRTGVIAGTPQFMSPEQARGETVDNRSDLFSLGVVLYTACTGRPPFRAEAAYGILRRITDSEPRPIQEINPDIPTWLCTLIDRLMAKHPADRFQTAVEVADLLEKCLAHLQQPTTVATPSSLLRPHIVPRKPNTRSQPVQYQLLRWSAYIMIACLLVFSAFFATFQITSAPDVSGVWDGENWNQISINSVNEAKNWYSGKFIDQNGKEGALHLEWSRIERRFNGRWTLGEGISGAITLRQGSGQSLRGAILVDTNSQLASDFPNLSDFVWQRGNPNAMSPNSPSNKTSKAVARADKAPSDPVQFTPGARSIWSPVKGIITQMPENLTQGAVLKKGDLLFEIKSNLDENGLQYALLQSEQALTSAQSKKDACLEHSKSLAEANHYAITAAENLVEAAKAKYRSKLELLASKEEDRVREEANLHRTQNLADKGFTSKEELELAKKVWQSSVAALESFKQEIIVLEKEWKAKQAETENKRVVGQAKVNEANAAVQDAISNIEELKNEISKIQSKIAAQQNTKVWAPVDGTVKLFSQFEKGQTVKEGDLLLTITPKGSFDGQFEGIRDTVVLKNSEDQPNRDPIQTIPRQNIGSKNWSVGDSGFSFDSASRLDQKIRQSNRQLSAIDKQITTAQESISTHEKALALSESQLAEAKKNDESKANTERISDLKHQIDLKRVNIKQILNTAEVYQRTKDRVQAERNAALREKETLVLLLRNELDSTERQLKLLKRVFEQSQAAYNTGRITGTKMIASELEYEEIKAKREKQKLLLHYFLQLGEVQTGNDN